MSLVIARKPGEEIEILLGGVQVGTIRISEDSNRSRVRLIVDCSRELDFRWQRESRPEPVSHVCDCSNWPQPTFCTRCCMDTKPLR